MILRSPVTVVRLGGRPDQPLLVLGPALGTSARTLWGVAGAHLAEHFQVVAWDLPGHGTNSTPVEDDFTVAQLAAGVLEAVNTMGTGLQPPAFHYAGVSVGGAVGLQLLLDAPHRVETAILLCTGARIGTSGSWAERVDEVRASGTASLTPSATQRWFAGGFLDRCPETGEALLSGLGDVVDEGYAAVCGALAGFDVRPRLGRIHTPVLAVAGADDVVTPTDSLREIAEGVMEGRLVVLDGVGHLAPAEAPQAVALLVLEHALGPDALPLGPGLAGGHGVDFDDLVTGLEVEGAWARPGLARRDRSLVALTALVAVGDLDGVAAHVRLARSHGVEVHEIEELLLQTALYCDVPSVRAAYRVARATLAAPPDGASG